MKEVLKFSASWCGPCKMLSMTIKGMDDLGVDIREIDIDENMDEVKKYGIRGVPTLVMLENGSEVKRISGAVGAPELRKFINE